MTKALILPNKHMKIYISNLGKLPNKTTKVSEKKAKKERARSDSIIKRREYKSVAFAKANATRIYIKL